MKRLLIFIDLLFFISSCTAVYIYFFISPVQNDSPNLFIIGIFLISLFTSLATLVTLVLYSPHLIIRRMRHQGLTKNFLWKPVMVASLRRGVFVGASVCGILLLNVLGQGGLVNTLFVVLIFSLLEVYFSRLV